MKNLVIVKPGCREFAHELENYLHLYTYGLEVGARVYNPAFFVYHPFFTFLPDEALYTRIFAYLSKKLPFTKKLLQALYALYARYIFRTHKTESVTAWRAPTFLPFDSAVSEKLAGCEEAYAFGWLFRQKEGLGKYRKQLLQAFTPQRHIQQKVDDIIASSGNTHTLIGVHLRQRPYIGFPQKEFLASPAYVRGILEKYLLQRNLQKNQVALILVSDKHIAPEFFGEYTAYISTEDEPTNLFLLAQCSVVIGENASFANLAAWFGNVEHVVTANLA